MSSVDAVTDDEYESAGVAVGVGERRRARRSACFTAVRYDAAVDSEDDDFLNIDRCGEEVRAMGEGMPERSCAVVRVVKSVVNDDG